MTLDIVIAGLAITSSWGNGHATTYRSLVRGLSARGHRVLFLERDVRWYAENRDLPRPPGARTELYGSLPELFDRFRREVRRADLVIVGSYVPQGAALGEWVLATTRGVAAFYDIDTPVTLSRLDRGDEEYVTRGLVSRYDLYLSFTGGPTLARLERELGSPAARPLYCSVDPEVHGPDGGAKRWDVGYLGTYSPDRQPAVERLLLEPAARWPRGRFVLCGAGYPPDVRFPGNVERFDHLPPPRHRAFYGAQEVTLNVTRAEMIRAGYSPSVRLFEAAACGTPIASDPWPGLDEFFRPGEEISVVEKREDVLALFGPGKERARRRQAERARARVLAEHTSERRAEELEGYARERLDARSRKGRGSRTSSRWTRRVAAAPSLIPARGVVPGEHGS